MTGKRRLSQAQLEQRRDAASKGGLKGGPAVLEKYGPEHFRDMGRRGGRPTFEQMLDRARLKEQESKALSNPGRKRSQ